MIGRVLCLTSLLVLAACAGVEQRPMTAEEMPQPSRCRALPPRHPAAPQRAYDQATGTDFRRMVLRGGSKFAVVQYASVTGAYFWRDRDTRSWIASTLPSKLEPSWGASGSLGDAASPTTWQSFDLKDNVRCVGLKRDADWHAEATGALSSAKALIVAIYCRPGTAPLDPNEARDVSAALRLKA